MGEYYSEHTGAEVDSAVSDVPNKLNKYVSGTVSANNPAYVVESYRDGATWYRLYSDGWCEQGGRGSGTITLPKAFIDTNYTVSISQYAAGGHETNVSVESLTTTSFVISSYNSMWYACGMTV